MGDFDTVLLKFLSHFLLESILSFVITIYDKLVYHSVYSLRSWTCISVLFDAPGSLPLSYELNLLGEQVVVHHVLAADPAPLRRGDVAGDPEVSEHSDIVLKLLLNKT